MKKTKTLIVYYSRTGNTKVVAELIQAKVGGDLAQIETKRNRSGLQTTDKKSRRMNENKMKLYCQS